MPGPLTFRKPDYFQLFANEGCQLLFLYFLPARDSKTKIPSQIYKLAILVPRLAFWAESGYLIDIQVAVE